MGESTEIAWTDATYNPWHGCSRVSPGCTNCYAEAFDKRTHGAAGAHWGRGVERRVFGDKHWAEPLKWNAAAEKAGIRRRVFCASMADVFDLEAPAGQRERLWALIRATPWLDWQLLTKRPENIAAMLPPDWSDGYPNVWMGCTAENQEYLDKRLPHLAAVPARVHFLSCEPLLSDLDLGPAFRAGITWVIVGGESGGNRRIVDLAWIHSIAAQCAFEACALFVKQDSALRSGAQGRIPDALFQVKEFPERL